MSEHEWDICHDLLQLAEALPIEGLERKVQLFCCASCRRLGSLLQNHEFLPNLELAQNYADGKVSTECVDQAIIRLQDYLQSLQDQNAQSTAVLFAGLAIFHTLAGPFSGIGTALVSERVTWALWNASGRNDAILEEEKKAQLQLFRDVLGNPFRPSRLSNCCLHWKNGLIPQLAHDAYQRGQFDHLINIADALEESGCPDFDCIDHLRGQETHVRGCWVIDQILERSANQVRSERSVG